jgi:hypothetical protein
MEGIADPFMSYIIFGLLGLTLTYSGIEPILKLALGMTLMGLIVYYSKKQLFNDTVMSFLFAMYLTFVSGGHPDAIFIFLFTLYIISLSVTIMVTNQLALFLLLAPPFFALAIRMVLALDALATSVYVSILFLIWYAWIRTAVGNRANPLRT